MRSLAACCALLLCTSAIAAADTVTVPGSYPTIQKAIDAAPDGSVIQVAPGRYHERLSISVVTRTLTLRGDPSDPSQVVIDGDGGSDPVIEVINTGSNVAIEGITVTNGTGGGLLMGGSQVTVRDSVFTGNSNGQGGGASIHASGGLFQRVVFSHNTAKMQGGGVLLIEGSTTTFEQCQFVDNQSGTADPTFTYAGGVLVAASSPIFVACTIAGNRSGYAAGGIAATTHFSETPTVVVLRDTVISGNAAVRTSTSPPSAGGGMHIEDNVTAVLERCHVYGNTAQIGGGLTSYRAVYSISDSIIENNQANFDNGEGGTGGGIDIASLNTSPPAQRPASLTLTRSVVRGNTSADLGGAISAVGDFGLTANKSIVTIEDSLLVDNVAGHLGGAMYSNRGDVTILRSMILSNTVSAGGTYGGGLAAFDSTLVMSDTTVADNTSPNDGAGLYANYGGQVSIAASRFRGNVSQTPGGVAGSAIATGPSSSPVGGTVTDSLIADNGSAYQVSENACNAANASTILYANNTFHATGLPFYRACQGALSTAELNAIAGKGSANVDGAASFADVLAAPATIAPGGTSVLAWSAAGHGSLDVTPGLGTVAGPTASADVSPASTTTYTLGGAATSLGTTTVSVTCGLLGTPFPRSPAQDATADDADAVILAWYEATGATAYDVYLDTGDVPATRVAEDVTDASLAVPDLLPDTTYRWRVVAKSPLCATPETGPVATFRTGLPCAFREDFEAPDMSGWTKAGRGRTKVTQGRLYLKAKGRLTMLPPAPALADGTVSMDFALPARKGDVRLVFGYVNRRDLAELIVRPNGVRLVDRVKGRARTIAKRRRKVAREAFMPLRLDVSGTDVRLQLDGDTIFTATLPGARQGPVGLGAVKGSFYVEDICIAPTL
jgi:Right handed beta helix region